MQQQIEIAAKLYQARDAMRKLWREEYAEKVRENQTYIRLLMEKLNIDSLAATMKLVDVAQRNYADSGMVQALIFASYVEMIELSEPEIK